MAVTLTPTRPDAAGRQPSGDPSSGSARRIRPTGPRRPPGRRWRSAPLRSGQIVTTQVVAAAIVVVAGQGHLATAATTLAAAVLLTVTWSRVRRRWLHEWLVIGVGFLARRHAARPDDGPTELLDLVNPDTVIRRVELGDGSLAVLDDPGGLVALLEIGDPADLLGDREQPLPSPASLLPAETDPGPPVRVQLLLTGTPAPAVGAGGGAAAVSYRQLTDGQLAGRERAVLAVRVSRARGWPEETLRHALAGTVRRIVRRLRPLAVRPMGEQPIRRVLAEFAHHDGRPVRESWQAVRCGDLLQTTFWLSRWPGGQAATFVPRLWTLPATAITVSLPAGTERPPASGLLVRLAAATPAELSDAARQLRRTAVAEGVTVERLDGRQLDALAGTLPLARPGTPLLTGAGNPKRVARYGAVDLVREVPFGGAGLVLGVNRHGDAVTVRLFRPESTRLMIVGGVSVAQLVAVRAMALGARVIVQTARPHAWARFVRDTGVPGGPVSLVPPGRPVTGAPGTPLAPVLVVLDAAPPAGPRPGTAWHTTLLVRDVLTPADADALGRVDLAVFQPLSRAEASVAGNALGLGDAAESLTRSRHDMLAVVNRRALRWALLARTPIETQLIDARAIDRAG
ncbi:type VII secretion protein EccE [Verrucosispora sp. WMMC514]|uniref:type VII secretion protein EccE n=1 Tax=Verrucosispora sp. WMMC514 TaxID=3015156 RepID=UPI00248D3146|nr:type VII secretion protein EccE [Verrucosispora sp. WMMC514]WBB93919.1 type VII secretion protein EccE [Verrucosispora sp. WMMC514]